MEHLTIGFLGLGLIGGSLAKGIRKSFPQHTIYAYNHRRSSIEPALQDGILDDIWDDIDSRFSSCDVIFLCAPVEQNARYLEKLAPLVNSDVIISDVGSTKTMIHERAKELGLQQQFIGGHPMTGSEKFGYNYSTDFLLENAYYILTPFPETDLKKLQLLNELVRSCGALTVTLNYEEHDYITAAISHVPHIIAAGLVNLVHEEDGEKQWMKRLAAGGFKDITRIASSSPVMWQEICTANKENILTVLHHYIEKLQQMEQLLQERDGDSIYEFFDQARLYRDSIPASAKGSLPRDYVLYCDIRDETGAIARVTTQLSEQHISIKNITIVHNREFEQGALRVEFYDELSASTAETVLKSLGHSVSVRH